MLPARRPGRSSPPLTVQVLEDRTVPAADLFISEVHFAFSLSGSQDKEQYVEIRGAANTVLPQGTYFVTVDADVNSGTGPQPAGTVNSVFDLSGVQLGSDGYLLILQAGSSFNVNPNATIVKGTTTGFGGLQAPGDSPSRDRFSDNSTLSNRFEFIQGADTFMLVRSPTAPVANADYDTNDDGILDGAASKWTVSDAVGELGTFVGADPKQISYGKVSFGVRDASGIPQGRVPVGTQFIPSSSFGYVARLGESTGWTAADWMAGLTRETAANSYDFVLDPLFFGQPTIGYLAGRHLDNLGTSNFVAPIEGFKFLDSNGNGALDPGEGGQQGATFYLDLNGNGVFDSNETTVEPDNYTVGATNPLTNVVPGLTLTVADSKNIQSRVDVNARTSTGTTGTQTFGYFGFDWFDDGARLRMDFIHPVQSISIDYLSTTGSGAPGDTFNSFGRLRVYSADGTELTNYLTRELGANQSETMTINRPTADIAYAVAYTDSTLRFNFGHLDNLRFSQPEFTGTSGADGMYHINVQDGTYTVHELRSPGFVRTFPAAPGTYTATVVNEIPVRHLDFGNTGGSSTSVGLLPSGMDGGLVTVFQANDLGAYGGQATAALTPFPGFTGAIRPALADVDGDGYADYVLATGPQAGYPTRITVISGRDQAIMLAPTAPFSGSEDFDGGAFVAAADFTGDGKADVVVSPDQGGGARVVIFSVSGGRARVIGNFLGITDPNFRGGARVAAGDVNADGTPDLAVSAGFLGGPRVAVFNGTTVLGASPTRLTGDFFAFPGSDATDLRNGAYIAIGDLNGDGFGDLIFGGGSGGAPRVLALSGKQLLTSGVTTALGNPLYNFFVGGDVDGRGGVRVAAVNADGDSKLDLAVSSGGGRQGAVRVYLSRGLPVGGEPGNPQDILLSNDPLADGVYVG